MASKKEELATLVEQIAEAQGHIEVTKKQMLAGMRRSDQTITAAHARLMDWESSKLFRNTLLVDGSIVRLAENTAAENPPTRETKEQRDALYDQKEELVLKMHQQTANRDTLLSDPRVQEAYNKIVAAGSIDKWIRSDTDKAKQQALAHIENHRKVLQIAVDRKIELLRRKYKLENE